MGWLAAIASLAGPITARVLLALGFSVVTFSGVALSVSQLKDMVIARLSEGNVAALQLVGVAGGWTALGMIFGAMTFAVSMWTLTKATQIVGAQ